MGCASSKQKKCKHCQAPYSPIIRRSFSLNANHPPVNKADNYHLVALTTSSFDSVKLEIPPDMTAKEIKWLDDLEEDNDSNKKTPDACIETKEQFAMGMIEAKSWSKMIDEKITKVVSTTPIRTPPGEPETINVKELMEGLEDTSPLRLRDHLRSFSFHVSADSVPPLVDSPRTMPQVGELGSIRKTWFEEHEKENALSNGNMLSNVIISDFDPEVISAFRNALEELSPTHPFHLKPPDCVHQQQIVKNGVLEEKDVNGMESIDGFKKLNEISLIETIEEKLDEEVAKDNALPGAIASNEHNHEYDIDEKMNKGFGIENGNVHTNGYAERETTKEKTNDGFVVGNGNVNCAKEKVVLYFTSLRGVRKTYEDCCSVRLILKGLGVRVDERDVSMHSGFKEELKELLADKGFKGGLPKVFVGERYIGGAEEIRQMHEDGQLEKLVKDCEMLEDDGGNLVVVCEACGDIRFVPCETCSGSCKIYYEPGDENQDHQDDEYGFQRCPDCNENGLVRCPICCY